MQQKDEIPQSASELRITNQKTWQKIRNQFHPNLKEQYKKETPQAKYNKILKERKTKTT